MLSEFIINFLITFIITWIIIELLVFIFSLFTKEKTVKSSHTEYVNIEKLIERNVKKIINQMNLETKKEKDVIIVKKEEVKIEENIQEVDEIEDESINEETVEIEDLLKQCDLEIIKPILDDLGVNNSNDLKLLTLEDIKDNIDKKEEIDLKLVEIKKLELLMKK
jgi:hypothetical protein